MRWLPLILLATQYAIGEAWQLAPAGGEWSPVISGYYDTPQWIVKEISAQVQLIMIAVILLMVAKDRILRIFFIAYLTYTILDTIAWFIDHKQWPYYWAVYTGVALCEITGLTLKLKR